MRRLPLPLGALSVLLTLRVAHAEQPSPFDLDPEAAQASDATARSAPQATGPLPHPLERTPDALVARVRALRHLPLAERIDGISEPWLGRAYRLGPLGEVSGIDTDPVTRYDAFDCLTFLEEVYALALAPDPSAAHQVRMALRYRDDSAWDYDNRRHFMLSEWIPGVVQDGWFDDITASLPGAQAHTKTVTELTWKGWRRRSLFPLDDDRLPKGDLHFHVLPLAAAADALDQIPDGSLVFTVRALYDAVPIAITHVGFTVPGDQPTMRHASRMGRKVVRDDDLAWYVRHLGTYNKWPSEGLIVLTPQEYGPTPANLARLRLEQAQDAQ